MSKVPPRIVKTIGVRHIISNRTLEWLAQHHEYIQIESGVNQEKRQVVFRVTVSFDDGESVTGESDDFGGDLTQAVHRCLERLHEFRDSQQAQVMMQLKGWEEKT